MIRSFICLPVPEYFLLSCQDSIKHAYINYDLKMQPKEKGHLTLQFIGGVTSEQVTKINNMLKNIAIKYQPIKITANGLSIISKGAYNLAVIKIEKSKELIALKKEVSRCLQSLEVCNEDSKVYYPHITLAKMPKHVKQYNDSLIFNKSFESSRIILMKSTLLPDGSRFNVLGNYLFQNAQG